ncbi:MAG: energy-coupling factor ABC transporter ATP-binding protein [Chloroflexi bacterium]|nr:energy-coupling factor ABC transporter ATP-binding protein [Chloroflexota bacterium]
MITLEHLTYTYPQASQPVLNDLSLEIDDGDFVLVAGPSGSGKSTLLRCLNGLVPHFYGGHLTGSVRVAGVNPVAESPRRMAGIVGMVFQDPETQFVVDTVESELVFAMENANVPPADMRRRVEEVLDQLNITPLRQRRISTLSGGEKQRVAIAAILTLRPQVLVLDEPTSQLDPQAAEEVLIALRQLNTDLGMTIILSEHRLERVVQFADRLLYLPGQGGDLIDGTPQEVLRHMPAVPPLADLGRQVGWRPLPLTIREARRYPPLPLKADTGSPAQPERAGEPAIRIEKLHYAYGGTPALAGIDLQTWGGKVVALMGRNGSGKSTLLKHLVGLLSPQSGRVLVMGQDTRKVDTEELVKLVGYVPQNPNSLLFADTVADELAFTRRAHSLPDHDPGELLKALHLGGLRERYPRDLSVGERQRVALAAILAAEPQIILLDEPTRGLDYAQKGLLEEILHAEKRAGHCVIVVTHDVELAAACADRVVILADGQVIEDGPTGAVMARSLVFSSQMVKLLRDERYLTVPDVLRDLA